MQNRFAFVGSRTTRARNARGEGISVFRIANDGFLELVHVQGDLVNPSYLAVNRARNRLYTVHGDESEVSSFEIGPDGGLAWLNTVTCNGRNPVHLALDPAESSLIVSNHLSGAVVVLDVEPDGKLGEVRQEVRLPGEPGPHKKEQPFSKPHFNLFDPSGRWVIVPDKGLDRIFVFSFEEGELRPAAAPWVDAREGAGPRHFDFHATLPRAYCINELDSTVTVYDFDSESGKLTPLQWLPSIPADYTGNNRGAAIRVQGDMLFASNRGHDSIAVYDVDSASGLLIYRQAILTQGKTPRGFGLLENYLFALNEDTDSIVAMSIDERAALRPTGRAVHCGSPVTMVFG